MEASGPQPRVARAPSRAVSSRIPGWIPGAILAAALLVVFGRTFLFPFLDWDDPTAVTQNPLLHPPTLEHLGRIWSEPWSGLYVPASFTAWWIEMRLSLTVDAARAPDPRIFHAGLLLLHFLASFFVLRVLRRLVDDPRAALLGALLFAIHPLQTESVAWITETRGVLASFLGLAALDVHLAGMSRKDGPSFALHHVPSAILFALAALSKPSAVAIPLIAFLIDRFRLRLPIARILPPVAVALVIVACDVLATTAEQASVRVASPLAARPVVALDALGFYLGKLVAPFRLAADYGRRPDRLFETSAVWWTASIPVAVAGVLAILPGRRTTLLALALFTAGLLPVLGLARFDYQAISTVADRYAYLALLGPAFALAVFASSRKSPRTALVAAGVVLASGAITFLDVPRWKDTETLFARTLEVNPRSHIAWVQLGSLDERAGKLDDALAKYRRALEITPGYPVAAGNVGRILCAKGDFDGAVAILRETVQRDPDYPYAAQDLGIALARRGIQGTEEKRKADFAEAESVLRATIAQQSGFPGAHLTLGQLLFTEGRVREAAAEFEATLAILPDSADAAHGFELCRQKLSGGSSSGRP